MNIDKIIKIVQNKGTICSSDLKNTGISRTMLQYMESRGILRRIARGVYTRIDYFPKYETYVKIMTSAPKSVICLLSALQFHEITTQMPHETWVAIEQNATKPNLNNIKLVRLSGQVFASGIETHESDGFSIRVYCPAKTIVDCFKFRNKIGIDIAREALTDCLAQKKTTRDEIWQYAKICKMTNVMRSYLEMT